jgi:hypothetical protein
VLRACIHVRARLCDGRMRVRVRVCVCARVRACACASRQSNSPGRMPSVRQPRHHPQDIGGAPVSRVRLKSDSVVLLRPLSGGFTPAALLCSLNNNTATTQRDSARYARFVMLVRDPIDRLVSHINDDIRRGPHHADRFPTDDSAVQTRLKTMVER